MVKNYLLDTNILLSNPNSIYGFEDNNVYLCGTTMQELDSKKTAPGELGYNAREACRILDTLREQGDLTDGVPLESGGKLIIEPDGVKQELLPEGFSISVPDNRIISTCLYLNKEKLKKSPIILLTNDISMRVNATICGLEVQGVRNDVVEDVNYTGHIEIHTTDKNILRLKEEKKIEAFDIEGSLYENEFITLIGEKEKYLAVYRDGVFKAVEQMTLYGGVKPLNRMQIFAMYALMAPVEDIPLVILSGPAGCAKTFLSLAAGLSQTNLGHGMKDGQYRKILISKPNTGSSDPGFGFLPGDLDSKMQPLLMNYRDNLESLMRGQDGEEEDNDFIQAQIDDLFDAGVIEMCPLSYIRGRTLYNSFIICDEAQNASKGLIRDLVTRASGLSKVVVIGDEKQIDVPTLDSRNNGLIYCANSMMSSPLSAIIRFSEEECVRSPLAEAAIKLMK